MPPDWPNKMKTKICTQLQEFCALPHEVPSPTPNLFVSELELYMVGEAPPTSYLLVFSLVLFAFWGSPDNTLF